ncbi:unnamed protein product [Acanthosepion pharaonis]|uniref:Uncharacterized protein n=1 Tax=Acanthosepion pharaonis TaxID=158019 RepID=A0A812E8C8_ACAPH|nr:unnamed protein product [Sepia pharaonis]
MHFIIEPCLESTLREGKLREIGYLTLSPFVYSLSLSLSLSLSFSKKKNSLVHLFNKNTVTLFSLQPSRELTDSFFYVCLIFFILDYLSIYLSIYLSRSVHISAFLCILLIILYLSITLSISLCSYLSTPLAYNTSFTAPRRVTDRLHVDEAS